VGEPPIFQDDAVAAVRSAVLAWHAGNALPAPWRESRDPYQALVAAVMAQQTQMARVLPAFDTFLARFPSVADLAAASRADAVRAWRGLGYNRRAVLLHQAARLVVERFGGRFPADPAELRRLPGCGDFTAAIVASFAFDVPVAAVDTNVRRVVARALLGFGDPAAAHPADVRALAQRLVPESAPGRWNQALMDLGGQVCVPVPRCPDCPLAALCAVRRLPDGTTRERRGRYGVPYAGSRRYYRGRIVDVLRTAGTAGVSFAILRRRVGDGALPQTELAALVEALAADGLVEQAAGRVRLRE